MKKNNSAGQTTWRPHRFAAVILACIFIYGLLGFLVVPWLAPGIAANKVRDVIGGELQIDDVALNPFTFAVDIRGIVLDDAAGNAIARIGQVHSNFDPTALFGRRLKFSDTQIDTPVLRLHRAANGSLNLASLTPEVPENKANDVDASGPGWELEIEQFDIHGMSVRFIDETVSPQADLGLTNLELSAKGVSTQPDSPFPIAVSMQLSTGGRVGANGNVSLAPAPIAELALTLDEVSLELLHPYVKRMADITLDSGALNFDGTIASSPLDPFALDGDAAIVDLLMTETKVGTRLGSWDHVAANQIALSLGDRRLSISEIIADSAYADILVAADGSINLARAGKSDATAAEPTEQAQEQKTTVAHTDSEPMNITIGRILIRDAAAAFEDRSLPLPFVAQIHDLNGELSTIATESAEPSQIELEGRVDEYGQVVVSGSVMPLEVARATDIKVNFTNVEMPKFSAYTIRFAGHEITSGKLDLELHYTLAESEIVGENAIVLHDFVLGDKVPHPGAADLPLKLAVALLKDSSGRISVDVPIRGNLDDPQFQIGGIVASALGDVVTGIVASPFKLLGKLVGASPDDLEALYFMPGRAELSPPQQEIAVQLAEALALRPQLILELPGTWVASADEPALREQAVDVALEAAIAAAGDAPYAERRIAAIESMYADRLGPPTGEPVEDPVARAAAMRQEIIAIEVVPEGALEALADNRTVNTRDAILGANPDLASQIVLLPAEQARRLDDNQVRMEVRLATRAD